MISRRNLSRAFVVAWIALGVLGALNHTLAERFFGRTFDLVLPHLAYGHVMFNRNPRVVPVFEYAGADGVRRNIAELVRVPAPGYKRTRTAINLLLYPEHLRDVCSRAAARRRGETLAFFIDEYDVAADPRLPARTTEYLCGPDGLRPR
jgi:hypothetical protein